MSIGTGWNENIHIVEFELQDLASGLLKEKLGDIFGKLQENYRAKNEKQAMSNGIKESPRET